MALENNSAGKPVRGVAADWTSADPVLDRGAKGFETDTHMHKIGNGVDPWTMLDYVPDVQALNHLLNG